MGYLRIPESNLAGTIGTTIATMSGTVTTKGLQATEKVKATLEAIGPQVDQIKQTVDAFLAQGNLPDEYVEDINKVVKTLDDTLQKIEDTLNRVGSAIGTIETTINTVKTTTVSALEAPLTALTVLVNVLKALPLPQRYLPVSFTMIEGDVLEMITELIAQAREQVSSLTKILDGISESLGPLRSILENLKYIVEWLRLKLTLIQMSQKDREVYSSVYGTGETILEVCLRGLANNSDWEDWGSRLDINSPSVVEQLRTKTVGDTVEGDLFFVGTRIEDYYIWSEDTPPLPKRNPVDEGWAQCPEETNENINSGKVLWRIQVLIKGPNDMYGMIQGGAAAKVDDVQAALEEAKRWQKEQDLTNSTGKVKALLIGESNFRGKLSGIVKPFSWEELKRLILGDIDNLPLSDGLFGFMERPEMSEEKVDGLKAYKFNDLTFFFQVIREQGIATIRYVKVTDQDGKQVCTTSRTFSTDEDMLIKEAQLKLEQLLG